MRDIGKNIKQIRAAKKMSQEDLAKALYVTRQTVSNYENSKSKPDIDMLMKIAQVLDTDITVLLYGLSGTVDQKTERRRLVIAFSVTGILALIWVYCNHSEWVRYQLPLLRHLINLTVLPMAMLVGGWSMLQLLGLKNQFKMLSERCVKNCRLFLYVILGCLVIIPAPYVIWMAAAVFRMLFCTSVKMEFPYIPMYSPIALGIMKLIYHAPIVYAALGGAFWIAGIPFNRKYREA